MDRAERVALPVGTHEFVAGGTVLIVIEVTERTVEATAWPLHREEPLSCDTWHVHFADMAGEEMRRGEHA